MIKVHFFPSIYVENNVCQSLWTGYFGQWFSVIILCILYLIAFVFLLNLLDELQLVANDNASTKVHNFDI